MIQQFDIAQSMWDVFSKNGDDWIILTHWWGFLQELSIIYISNGFGGKISLIICSNVVFLIDFGINFDNMFFSELIMLVFIDFDTSNIVNKVPLIIKFVERKWRLAHKNSNKRLIYYSNNGFINSIKFIKVNKNLFI